MLGTHKNHGLEFKRIFKVIEQGTAQQSKHPNFRAVPLVLNQNKPQLHFTERITPMNTNQS